MSKKVLGKSINTLNPKEIVSDYKLQEKIEEADDDYNEGDEIEYSGSEIEVCNVCGEEECACDSDESQEEEESEDDVDEVASLVKSRKGRKPVAYIERVYYYDEKHLPDHYRSAPIAIPKADELKSSKQ